MMSLMQAAFKWEWAVEIFKFVTSSKESRQFGETVLQNVSLHLTERSIKYSKSVVWAWSSFLPNFKTMETVEKGKLGR